MKEFQMRQPEGLSIDYVDDGMSYYKETPYHDWLAFKPLMNLEVWSSSLDIEDLDLWRQELLQKYRGSFVQQDFRWQLVDSTDQIYWALRLGYVDFLISNPEYGHSEENPARIEEPEKPSLSGETIQSFILRQVRMEKDFAATRELLLERLPPDDKSLMTTIVDGLGRTMTYLPSSVIDDLKDAERLFSTKSDRATCRLKYFKVIEGIFKDVFVNPLMNYLQANGFQDVILPRHGGRPKLLKRRDLDYIQILEWSQILRDLPVFITKSEEQQVITSFLQHRLGRTSLPDMAGISEGMRSAQEARAGAAHAISTQARYDTEIRGIDQLRRLIYGGDSESLIESMLETLTNREYPSDIEIEDLNK